MIVELLAKLFFGLVSLLINLIPNIELNTSFMGAFGTVGEFFGYVDNFVSINVILTCVGLIFIVDNISFIVKIFNFIIRKIPTIS